MHEGIRISNGFCDLFTFVAKSQKLVGLRWLDGITEEKKRIISDAIRHRMYCNYKFLKGGLKVSMGGLNKI